MIWIQAKAPRVRRLLRVCEPPLTHREWLLLFQLGHISAAASASALGRCLCDDVHCTLERRAGHVATTAAGPLELDGRDAVLRELLPTVARTKGHVLHIGRTRHLPGGTPRPPATTVPLVTQTVLIGNWRSPGEKWYGGMGEFALQETVEWRDGRVGSLRREILPRDHPHARPVWARLREKRLQAKAAAKGAAAMAARAQWKPEKSWFMASDNAKEEVAAAQAAAEQRAKDATTRVRTAAFVAQQEEKGLGKGGLLRQRRPPTIVVEQDAEGLAKASAKAAKPKAEAAAKAEAMAVDKKAQKVSQEKERLRRTGGLCGGQDGARKEAPAADKRVAAQAMRKAQLAVLANWM